MCLPGAAAGRPAVPGFQQRLVQTPAAFTPAATKQQEQTKYTHTALSKV